jgi:DNA polymerase-3 subunit delta'
MPSILIHGASPDRLKAEALARARSWICPNHEESPPCPDCRRILERTHPDFRVLAPEGAQIRVDRARDALRFAAGRPYEAPARVVWVEQADRLGPEAANALLKSLEEPGGAMTWILTAGSPDGLLPTIRSRCAEIRLSPERRKGFLERLQDRGISAADAEDAFAFGLDSDGEDLESARRRRSLTLQALAAGETSSLLALANEFAEDDQWPPLLASLLRDAAILAAGAAPDRLRHRGTAALLSRVAKTYSPDALRRAAIEADALPEDDRRSRPKRLSRERLLVRLRRDSRRRGIGGRP